MYTCKTCAHKAPGAQSMLCTRYPPTLFMVMVPSALHPANPQPAFISQYPMVQPDQTCGEWESDAEVEYGQTQLQHN